METAYTLYVAEENFIVWMCHFVDCTTVHTADDSTSQLSISVPLISVLIFIPVPHEINLTV